MSALLDNPAYKPVRVLRLDWDEFKKTDLKSELKVPRRSTLIAYAKGNEVDRVIAESSEDRLEAMFKAALAGA